MTDEAKNLQARVIREAEDLLLHTEKTPLVCQAPTGSGKTWMMAHMMNDILSSPSGQDVVFLVSALSKGGLARQNFEKFCGYRAAGMFPALRPFLIESDYAGEGRLVIPETANVYVLPTANNRKNGRLNRGALLQFYEDMRDRKKRLWLVKDECHIATRSLDEQFQAFMEKEIAFSATPKLARGQEPDVVMEDTEAVQARLIKAVQVHDPEEPVTSALDRLKALQEPYRCLLGMNPCLIIQISNKTEGAEQWDSLRKLLSEQYPDLTWMYIVDDPKKCDTNDRLKNIRDIGRWKAYARDGSSRIDVIVFKLTITEGWDIPRACLLYQIRDTKSRQLDEQVIGRIRRNPRLADFERLPKEAQDLASLAEVWGIADKAVHESRLVVLAEHVKDFLRVHPTRLKPVSEHRELDLPAFLSGKQVRPQNLFQAGGALLREPEPVLAMCRAYADTPEKLWLFLSNLDSVREKAEACESDYSQMEIGEEVTLPAFSFYDETPFRVDIPNWIWMRAERSRNGNEPVSFSFDSEAEKRWASLLLTLASTDAVSKIPSDRPRYLWGKNFPFQSELNFAYYLDGIHASFPDFVMKDRRGKIRIFEVKSVNQSRAGLVDEEAYLAKVRAIREGYRQASRKLPYVFYLPVQTGDDWIIYRSEGGAETQSTVADLSDELSAK